MANDYIYFSQNIDLNFWKVDMTRNSNFEDITIFIRNLSIIINRAKIKIPEKNNRARQNGELFKKLKILPTICFIS